MASAECDIELEDGEINDLEDGEIDEDILLPTESNNNVFSRLEPRQHAYPENSNSYGAIRRDFVHHNLGPSSGRWETQGGPITPSRGRFPRGRTTPPRVLRGGRGKSSFRGNGRQVMGRGKPFAAKRENTRQHFLQRPNLPHSPSVERSRGPYPQKRGPGYTDNERLRQASSQPENKARAPHLDERWHGHGYPDTERPRLPHPLLNERQRLPLMELDEKSWPSYNTGVDSIAPAPDQQSARMESPLDEEEVDDYRILLQRHRLIQQQLAALEKQESSTLEEENIIDDTFIDIPVEDTQPDQSFVNEGNLESFTDSLVENPERDELMNLQQSNLNRNLTNVVNSGELENSEQIDDLFMSGKPENSNSPKPFVPFRIKPRYTGVPSIKELSQKDLELRGAKEGTPTAGDSINEGNQLLKENNQAPSQHRNRTRGKLSRGRKNRKRRKRNFSQGGNQGSSAIDIQPSEKVGSNQNSHVDPHNELEARLMSLAGSSVPILEGTNENRQDVDFKKQERREKVRQWQEKMNKAGFSDQKSQPGNKVHPKKKPAKGNKRSATSQSLKSSESQRADREAHRRNVVRFDNDDYFEIPMDVESDSTDGPALPLIEEPVEDFPPPPPPLPNGDSAVPMYVVDQAQHPLLMYPPAGYFQIDQKYPEWMAGPAPLMSQGHNDQQFGYEEFARQTDELEQNHDQEQGHGQDMSSQDNSDDDDDEATLREQLLKSLAVKRRAKLDVGKETKSSPKQSSSSSSRVQSPTMAANNEQLKKLQQNSRQVSFVAPPKHEPVVIKLGEDSDSESDRSDAESSKKKVSSNKKAGNGLFGGLEMMIKEARKSAEASKVKSNADAESLQDDTGNPSRTDLPPEPKTPDAMDHMPEQMKTEYRRLKEQLAMREKTRQPLANVNQEKEDSCQISASEDQAEDSIEDNSSHLQKLHSYVTECEENLTKHKTFIQKDKAILNKTLSELKEKSRSLQAQEENVSKLRQQLEAAQKIALANRMLINRLRNQAKAVKEKVGKKQLAASNFEEDLLRAKSILSAVRRKMPDVGDTGSGRNSPQMDSLRGVCNENQKFMITSATAQEIQSSLAAKLDKLSALSKLENREKRKLEGNSDSSEETVSKKAKPASSLPGEASPASSGPGTPRKSAVAERLAQEKARLKKLEHELLLKLKSFGRHQEEEKNHPSLSKQSQNNDNTELERVDGQKMRAQQLSDGSGKQVLESRDQHLQLPAGNEKDASPKDTQSQEVKKISISPEQLEWIRKLQAEKEKNGQHFSGLSPDVPAVAAHQHSTLCVWLPFDGDLSSTVTDDDTCDLCKEQEGGMRSVAEEPSGKECNDLISCPLEKYHSLLRYFRSYRLSPYFRIEQGLSLTSLTFSNKLNFNWPLCNFDLQGKCNDEDCNFQHFAKCKLSKEQTLQDLASYNPNFTVENQELQEIQENIESFTKAFAKQYQDKMTWEELCILLANDLRKTRKGNGPFNIALHPRSWRLKQGDKKEEEFIEDSIPDLGRGIVFVKRDKIHGAVTQTRETAKKKARPVNEESQEIRYFVEEYNNIETLEDSLENSPTDVALWITLARLKLHEKPVDINTENEDTITNNIAQALSTLSRGLEENTHSEELWLEYLELYSSQSTQDELREICDQAVEYSPTYSVWWQYLEYSETYHAKKTVCLRLLSFLVENLVDPRELHSHHILETLLYLVQLELYSGHYKSALAVFQSAIAKKRNSSEVADLSVHMLPSDCCLAWLAYIHVFEFHRLPTPWFDPQQGKPSRMVTKEDFVFPWKPSKQSRASGEKLLALFQDALKACTALVKSSSSRLNVCLPLYKNLIALERAYGRISSAEGICRHLLKDNPSVVVLWLCLAALEDAMKKPGEVEKVYKEALLRCKCHAEVSYSAARYYLEQREVQKAVLVLVKCVLNKFASDSKTPEGEVLSLAAATPSEHNGPDPIALYRRLLSQPLPYDYKCPSLMQGVLPQSLGREKLFLWLSYCLLLEISPPNSSEWDNLTPDAAFETAVHSPLDRQDIQILWTEYLLYQRSKVLKRDKSSSVPGQSMDELVNRCLMSVSTSSSLPHSSSAVWQDHRFHNQVISISLSCKSQSSWSAYFQKYLRLFPGNVNLALWACKHEVEKKNLDQAKRISSSFVSEHPHCISMWKGLNQPDILERLSPLFKAISVELRRHCIKEARKMYQQATMVIPLGATLWKDYLMFELAQSGDGPDVQEIVAKGCEIGVDLEEFLNTLLGK